MKVVCLAPVPVASMPWRIAGNPWVLTVVCKLTLLLEPGDAVLAKRHEPIYDRDKFHQDNPEAGLYAPSDLVPSRPLVDVMLVGDAYAPRGSGAVTTLTARLAVQTIDKKVQINAPEGTDGFKVAALDYEHADAPESENDGSGDGSHTIVASGDALVAGFGPIAPSWPERKSLLRGEPQLDSVEPGQSWELPKDFNLKFFNAAPADQQLPELPPNAQLVLENLHPEHPLLETRLPNVAPQVFVDRAGGKREEQPTEISALWIDTRRSVVAVTWHSHVRLDSVDEPGKVLVAVAGAGRRLNGGGLSQLLGSLGGPTLDEPEQALRDDRTTDEDPKQNETQRRKGRKQAPPPLPNSDDTMTSIIMKAPAAGSERISERTAERTADGLPVAPDDGSPEWLGRKHGSASPPPMPSVGEAPASAQGLAPMRAPQATVPGMGGPAGGAAWMPRPPAPHLESKLKDTSSLPNVTAQSPSPPAAAARARPKPDLSEVTELLWFDSEATPRLRRRWPLLCDDLDFAPRDELHDLVTRDPKEARDHHIHFGLITEAGVTDANDLALELRGAISEKGRFSPPLVLLRGRIAFPFEELEILRATAAAVTPIAGDDKKLRASLAQVKELLDTPLLSGSAETVINFTQHLRTLYQQSKRKLSLEYLDETVRRSLLEQRRYQRRKLFGGEWIRALFAVVGSDKTLPAYLPSALADQLPMLTSFNARVIAEAHVRQDQYETHAHALKVVALGRVIELGDPA